ncbi:hypothetical protein KIL84_021621 [Mauremys mutica]|uniref:Uncharacterized protein n=1 Tax=Mauremys mutica TaxID=74926 RepID=A0A9D3X811_9SAUR|nr:hypothetical protein KIL84_021621 [Mauremys mutica]
MGLRGGQQAQPHAPWGVFTQGPEQTAELAGAQSNGQPLARGAGDGVGGESLPWTLKAGQTPASWEPPHSPGLRLAAVTAGRWATLLAASPEPAVLSPSFPPPPPNIQEAASD